MLRSLLAAVALAGLLALGQQAFADPLAGTASDHVQPAAAATEQPALLAPLSSSSDVTAPVNAEHGKAPVGFGWG